MRYEVSGMRYEVVGLAPTGLRINTPEKQIISPTITRGCPSPTLSPTALSPTALSPTLSPTALSPTDPVPRGLLTLLPAAY